MAIYHAVEQNTPEWIRMRLGIPCSSDFHCLVTPKTMKLSQQAVHYLYRLLAEWVTGEQLENYESKWMERGHELESQAVLAYELMTDTETQPGGFITTDDGMVGCSPDRLVGDVGDLELKSPLIQTQIEYALDPSALTKDYAAQLQGRLMIHGREWVDIFSFHPRLSIPPVRCYRDEKFIAALSETLKAFIEIMLEKRAELERRFGPFVRPEQAPRDDFGAFGVSDADVEMILAAQRARQASPSTGDI